MPRITFNIELDTDTASAEDAAESLLTILESALDLYIAESIVTVRIGEPKDD